MNSVEIKKIILEVASGAQIHKTKKEALLVALEKDQTVEFIFNDRLYTISPDIVANSIEPKVLSEEEAERYKEFKRL